MSAIGWAYCCQVYCGQVTLTLSGLCRLIRAGHQFEVGEKR
jgi:hypothetical protein